MSCHAAAGGRRAIAGRQLHAVMVSHCASLLLLDMSPERKGASSVKKTGLGNLSPKGISSRCSALACKDITRPPAQNSCVVPNSSSGPVPGAQQTTTACCSGSLSDDSWARKRRDLRRPPRSGTRSRKVKRKEREQVWRFGMHNFALTQVPEKSVSRMWMEAEGCAALCLVAFHSERHRRRR